MAFRWVGFALALSVAVPGLGFSAPRCKSRKRPEVFVRAKTPIRRGPGLNYQVSRFLVRGRCLPFAEVSMDRRWVLIEQADAFGWVPVRRLNKRSRERVNVTPSARAAAVGSAQFRGVSRVARPCLLLDRPDPRASPRRVLPRDVEVVPLAKTRDGRWAQVRDERGEVGWVLMANLVGGAWAALPVLQEGFNRGVAAGVRRSSRSRRPAESRSVRSGGSGRSDPEAAGGRIGRDGVEGQDGPGLAPLEHGSSDGASEQVAAPRAGIGLSGSGLVGVVVLTHQLDSNAELGRRRYELFALSPALAVRFELDALGPVVLRAGYLFALLYGVSPENIDAVGLGQLQQGIFRAGLPLDLGPVHVTPELGYSFGWFDFDSLFTDDPQTSNVVASKSHMAAAGARARWTATRSVMVEAEAALLLGVTLDVPRDLGENGLAYGFEGAIGARWSRDDTFGLVGHYLVKWHRTGFRGPSALDPTLTEATLTDLAHGFVLGISFVL